jgi:hypothetical protein
LSAPKNTTSRALSLTPTLCSTSRSLTPVNRPFEDRPCTERALFPEHSLPLTTSADRIDCRSPSESSAGVGEGHVDLALCQGRQRPVRHERQRSRRRDPAPESLSPRHPFRHHILQYGTSNCAGSHTAMAGPRHAVST